ncbi:hypothetical protein K523DRAFT_366607 [Schizophyllum commune Tattone D]|nr:hypothetical protein K523DRAFT_366607 [Schizophyllum commune Tattone D]
MAKTRAASRKSAPAQSTVAGTPPVSPAGGAPSEPVKKSTKGRSKKAVINEATKVADARKQASKKRAVNSRKKDTASASGAAGTSGSSAVPQASAPPTQTSTSPASPSTINAPPSTTPTPSTPPHALPSVQHASSSARLPPPSHAQAPTQPHTQPPLPPAQSTTQPSPPPAEPEVIVPIKRPPGQAGSRKRGYNLRDAMRLSGTKESRRLYRQIINTVHRNCDRYGVDSFEASWKGQEPENLGKVFKAGWRKHPYLTPQRFPGNWAQAAIVKQFVSNQRKHNNRKLREEAEGDDDDDDSDGDAPPAADLDGGAAL